MSNDRIDRMLRELHSEPSTGFFQQIFESLGLGTADKAPPTPQPRQRDQGEGKLGSMA